MFYRDLFKIVIYLLAIFFVSTRGINDSHEDKVMILKTEASLRNITSDLFSALNFSKDNPKLKETLLIHSYLTNITLVNQQTLNIITTLSRVENRVNTSNINIDEIINEGNKTNVDSTIAKSNEEVLRELDKYLELGEHNGTAPLDHFANFDIVNVKNILINDSFENQFPQVKENDTFDKVTNGNEYWVPLSARRIYKGQTIQPMQFPYIASIHIYENFKCAGSIIWTDLILTAASCLQIIWDTPLFQKNPSFISVRIGSDHFDTGGEVIRASQVYFHPGYNPRNLSENVAVIRLVRHILFDAQNIKKIVYDRKHGAPQSRFVTIAGWGSKGPRPVFDIYTDPTLLAYDELNVYTMKECREIYTSKYVSKKNFCAGYVERGSGACNHDVGGPGVAEGRLIGIISFGPKVCGTPDAPTVFSKVGYYSMWIDTIVDRSGQVTISTTPDDGLTGWPVNIQYHYTVSKPMFFGETPKKTTTWYEFVPQGTFVATRQTAWFEYVPEGPYYTEQNKKTNPWLNWLSTMSPWTISHKTYLPAWMTYAPRTQRPPKTLMTLESDDDTETPEPIRPPRTHKPHKTHRVPDSDTDSTEIIRPPKTNKHSESIKPSKTQKSAGTKMTPWLTWLDFNNITWPPWPPKKTSKASWWGQDNKGFNNNDRKEETFYYSVKNDENTAVSTEKLPKNKKIFKDISQMLNRFVKYIWK